jgi:hypothetical protein
LSRPARRGMYRATLVTAISMTMCFTGAAIGFAAVDHLSMTHPLLYVVLALIFGGIFLFFVGVLSIVWFNFPKFLVIPHARQHVGLAAVLRRARRIRRAARERAVPPARPR